MSKYVIHWLDAKRQWRHVATDDAASAYLAWFLIAHPKQHFTPHVSQASIRNHLGEDIEPSTLRSW